MIYIVIVLSSIMAFYFFTMAFIGEKQNAKELQESGQEKELSSAVETSNTYYEMPQIEKVKDITYGIPQIPVENGENTTMQIPQIPVENGENATAQIPQIVESKNVIATTPTIVENSEESKSIERNETINIPSFVEKSNDKIISDDEVI